MTQKRLCVDCKYLLWGWSCHRPREDEPTKKDLVTGESDDLWYNPWTQRRLEYLCGPKGRFWKPSLRYRLIHWFRRDNRDH